MDDVVSFLQQVGPAVLIVVLMVLMHAFGHGAHGHGEHREAARGDDAPSDPRSPRRS